LEFARYWDTFLHPGLASSIGIRIAPDVDDIDRGGWAMKSISHFLSLVVLITVCAAGKIFADEDKPLPVQSNPAHEMTKEGAEGTVHRYYYVPLNNPPFNNLPGTAEGTYGYVSRVLWNQKNQTRTFYLVPPDLSHGYLEVVFDKSGKILSSHRVQGGKMIASKVSRDEFKRDGALHNYLEALWKKNIGLVSRAMTPEEAKNPSEKYLIWSPLMGGMIPPPSAKSLMGDESLEGPPERGMQSRPFRSGLPLYESHGMIPPPSESSSMGGNFNQKAPQSLPPGATSP
jgi:hypothetical protein